ncbi:MAG: PAS domain S-box protein [Chloroflexi bacterium]|nr:PAS domain S-box protein [Chloroflexota bacterium]
MTMVVLYDLQTSSKNLSIKIIELESAEASRKSIETQLETIINTAPSAIISIDENQKIILFNQEAEQIFNYQETEVLGKPLEALLPPGSVEVHRKHIDNFVKSPEVHRTMAKRGRIQGQRKDGSIFPAEGNIAKVGVDGRTLFTVIMRDITERINAEAEIENLGRFPDENPNPVLRASSTGNILYANEAGNPLLESCGCAIGDRLPEKLLELSKKSYDTNEIIETDCDVGEKVFSFTIAPIMNESYVNLYGRDITERKQAEEKLQTQFDRLYALRKIDQAIASSFDKSIYLDIFLDQVTSQLNVDASAVLLFNSATNYLEYAASRGLGLNENRVEEFSSINTFAGTAVRERRMVKIPNLEDLTKEEFIYPEFEHFNVKAYFATPLISKGNVLGVLETFNHQPLYPDDDWFEFYERLAAQVGLALDNSKLFDDIQHSRNELLIAYDATLEGWARALALKDDETEEHTRRVTEMSVRLARHIKVPEKELAHIRRGALLHDMGKIGIPDSILLKEGPLDDEEWEVMKLHPVYARNFLKPINYLKPAIDIPYSHHEKWDGSGYPQGLKGEQIPLAARVFAVIDVWDALSSDRPYRDAWPQEKVIAYLQEQSGKHLDPSVVDAFLAMMNSNQDKFFRAMTHKN